MKKKAFTLTELLVVVVIIGVLSAVVLPKFTKVLEARKVGEAEEVMAAIRTEQEARCALDKKYTTSKNNLAVYPKNEGSNYTYELLAGGMKATSKSKGYTLQIKSYQDGKICCQGDYCTDLNKGYVDCNNYTPAANRDCEPQEVNPEPQPGPDPEPESEPDPEPEGCDETHTEGQITHFACECGEGDLTWHCGEDTQYTWESTTTKGCSPKPPTTEPCPEGYLGDVTVTYGCYDGVWRASDKDFSGCTKEEGTGTGETGTPSQVDCVKMVRQTQAYGGNTPSCMGACHGSQQCSQLHISEGAYLDASRFGESYRCVLECRCGDSLNNEVSFLKGQGNHQCYPTQLTEPTNY